jgi:hypothetical protein
MAMDGAEDVILTFNNLINRTKFVEIIGEMMAVLENAYGQPVDIEFTASVDSHERVHVNLLQCRPLEVSSRAGPVTVPEDVSRDRTLFRSSKIVSGGMVEKIRFIVYVDPRQYADISRMDVKKSLGRVVGRINSHPQVAQSKMIMMGPGRWGSSNIDLGVNVSYADIDNTAVLVEIAQEEAGHVPEVSYGTHFFQDLVEEQIIYLPVYPDDPATEFNEEFFARAPNVLTDLLPDAGEFADIVHVMDVPSAAGGAYVRVVADAQSRRAVCFLEPGVPCCEGEAKELDKVEEG